MQVHEHSRYKVLLSDPYWNLLVVSQSEYEPEVRAVLDTVLAPDVCFLDCGANCGYWSLKASELIGRSESVVAVEAASRMFARLESASILNSESFVPLHFAVDSVPGKEVSFECTELNHAGAAIAGLKNFGEEVKTEKVVTASIDSIVDQHLEEAQRLVIKLDVEGNELPALQGAARTFEREVLVVYEDLGLDPEQDITEWFLTRGDFSVFHYCDAGSYRAINSLDQVSVLRGSTAGKALNLIACKKGSRFEKALSGVEVQIG